MKQGRIQQQLPVFRLGLNFLPVYVNDVAEQLEGIKGNPDGQNNLRDFSGEPKQTGGQLGEKPQIFKDAKKAEHSDALKNQKHAAHRLFFMPLNLQSAEPGKPCFPQKKKQIAQSAPGIEKQGEAKKNGIPVFGRGKPVCSQVEWKKCKHKQQ